MPLFWSEANQKSVSELMFNSNVDVFSYIVHGMYEMFGDSLEDIAVQSI